jgi:hypothetical protein
MRAETHTYVLQSISHNCSTIKSFTGTDVTCHPAAHPLQQGAFPAARSMLPLQRSYL